MEENIDTGIGTGEDKQIMKTAPVFPYTVCDDCRTLLSWRGCVDTPDDEMWLECPKCGKTWQPNVDMDYSFAAQKGSIGDVEGAIQDLSLAAIERVESQQQQRSWIQKAIDFVLG